MIDETIFDKVGELLKDCNTTQDSFIKFAGLIRDGFFDENEYQPAMESLIEFIKNGDNLVTILTFIGMMYAYHPTYAEMLMTSPSVSNARKLAVKIAIKEMVNANSINFNGIRH